MDAREAAQEDDKNLMQQMEQELLEQVTYLSNMQRQAGTYRPVSKSAVKDHLNYPYPDGIPLHTWLWRIYKYTHDLAEMSRIAGVGEKTMLKAMEGFATRLSYDGMIRLVNHFKPMLA